MHDIKRMKDLVEAPELTTPPAPEVVPFVSCEVHTHPAGAAIAMSAPAADGSGEDCLMAALNPTQAREVAARLLMCADQACNGETRTVLVVTPERDWVPGQCLQVRFTPEPSYGFVMDTRDQSKKSPPAPLAVPSRKIILPGK